jgi:predicted TIM-barrel fold metal-dependent hydrolase
MIIDAHAHIWPEPSTKYPLHPRPDLADMSELPMLSLTDRELWKIATEHDIRKIMYVHKKQMRDALYLQDAIRRRPNTTVGTAAIDPRIDNLGEELDNLRQGGIRALRIYPQLSQSNPITWLQDSAHEQLFRLCNDMDLVVACMTGSETFPEVHRMCTKYPNVALTFDHCALIGRNGSAIDSEHVEELKELARQHENIRIKLSGFHNLGSKTPPYSDLESLTLDILSAFGPERCMYGSDNPYQMLGKNTLQASIDFIDLLPIPGSHKDTIFRGTAHELYFR